MNTEHLSTPLVELKELNEEGEFEGYASRFNVSDNGGDVVLPGAFARSLTQNPQPKMLWQHDPNYPIGKWTEVREDDQGLRVRGKILKATAKGAETLALLKEGILEGLSIGYRTVRAERDQQTGLRKLIDLELWEISVVTFPMLPEAGVTAVKDDWTKTDLSRVLRNAGVPSGFAKKLIAGGYQLASSTPDGPRNEDIGALTDSLRRATNLLRG